MRRICSASITLALLTGSLGCPPRDESATERWTLTDSAAELVAGRALESRIFEALDAASSAGTDPGISRYHVRAATVVEHEGRDHAIVGGNSEWAGYPEAIHGETSLMNHVINVVGPESARRDVDFLAFYTDGTCGGGGSCGDCRDYLMTTTRWRDLLMVCGSGSDHTVHAHRFSRWVVPEVDFPEVRPDATGISRQRLAELVEAAQEARAGGVALFTAAEEHLGVAALTSEGQIYRAAGADDAAFHYRYPLGAVLQQAAAHRDYFVEAVVVAGAPGRIPRVSYRDRQYGYESSSFNAKRGYPPIRLILLEESQSDAEVPALRYRMTTFEEALPGAFSAASFMPEAVDRFLDERARP
jgi:cytidine deaminase